MKFWMVWSEKSNETSHRHDTPQSARAEAERLAKTFPGVRFFVLGAEGFAAVPNPVKWEEIDEIPF